MINIYFNVVYFAFLISPNQVKLTLYLILEKVYILFIKSIYIKNFNKLIYRILVALKMLSKRHFDKIYRNYT